MQNRETRREWASLPASPSRFGPCISLLTPALAKLLGVLGLALSQARCPSKSGTCKTNRLDFDESPGCCQALAVHDCLRCGDIRWETPSLHTLSISSTIWSSQGKAPAPRLPLGEALQSGKQNPVCFSRANSLVKVFTTHNSHHTPEEDFRWES